MISSKILVSERNTLKKLKSNENFYYSGHIAGLTEESIEKTDLFIFENFFLRKFSS